MATHPWSAGDTLVYGLEAVVALRESLRVRPGWPEGGCQTYTVLAMAYHRLGRTPEAREALTKATEVINQWSQQWFAGSLPVPWYDWLPCQILYREATTLIDGAPAPEDARLVVVRGRAWAALGKTPEASACYAQAVKLSPDDVQIRLALLPSMQDRDQYARTLADLHEMLKRHPNQAAEGRHAFAQKCCDLGGTLREGQRFQHAAAAYSWAVEIDPKFALAWYELGVAYGQLGQYDKALADYSKAIELKPDYPGAWNNRGIAYWNLGQYDKAIADYSKVIELDPKYAPAWYNRGNGYTALGRMDKAVADYSKAIELKPDCSEAWNNRGCAYGNPGQDDKALADFSKAIELKPDNSEAWNNRGNAYLKQGQYDKAIADSSKAIALTPDHADAWFGRATCHQAMKQWPKAIADYSKFLQLASKHADAQNNLAWLLATCPEIRFRDAQRALELAKRAVELAPKQGGHWNTLGVAHYRAGDWKAAVAALEKSMELRKGGDAYDWFFLAMAHWKLGDAKEARQWYDRAVQGVEKNPPNSEELRLFHTEAADALGMKSNQ
jgi:tetratricopeptide (TPR) repeat protein